jgi:arylsulfatase A-like enzyme
MGHVFGDSEKFYKAVQQMDTQIGKIAQAISKREKKHKEEWLIFITTDHGRDEQTGKSHGGQSLRQRTTWMVTSYRALNSYARYYTPAIVDIMPSIARFMNIAIPLQVGRELDGIPLIGALSLAEVSVNHFQDKLDITWKALEDKGEVKVWISTTNQFKTGGKDNYQLMARVPLMNGHATIDVASIPSALYKIVVEGPSNSIVKWYLAQNNKE